MNYQLVFRSTLLSAAIIVAGCSESIDSPSEFAVDEACSVDTRPAPPPTPDQIITSSPITTMQALWDAMGIDDGSVNATRVAGSVPAPDGITQGFTFFQEISISDKSTAPIPVLSTEIPAGKRIGALFFQIEGVNEYAILPISGNSASITLRGPTPPEDQPDLELITLDFETQFAAGQPLIVRGLLVDAGESVDPTASAFSTDPADWMAPATEISDATNAPIIIPQSLGTGTFQITLIWDQANDLDLWLDEPDGNRIKWDNLLSVAGDGELDYDDVDGYGAENIFYSQDIPEGNFTVRVNYFGGEPRTNYVVIVRACGQTRTFNGTLENQGETDSILSFNYSAEGCTLVSIDTPSTPDFIEETSLCDIPSKDYPLAGEQDE